MEAYKMQTESLICLSGDTDHAADKAKDILIKNHINFEDEIEQFENPLNQFENPFSSLF